MPEVGLRIDVDTLRGARRGVPRLLELLAREGIRASFFFSVGPDNMGRHLWRLLRPAFLLKMLRSRAATLYGWDILLRGTLGPGPVIGRRAADIIRRTALAGHEIGLHAWDHHGWQSRIEKLEAEELAEIIGRGVAMLQGIIGWPPAAFAAPAWRITDPGLAALARFPFAYFSNCRGRGLFRPRSSAGGLFGLPPEIPTTLPTYDEFLACGGIPGEWNDHLLDSLRPRELNVLTIHAEVEGICEQERFAEFLVRAREREVAFRPLGALLPPAAARIPVAAIGRRQVPGREGWAAVPERDPKPQAGSS